MKKLFLICCTALALVGCGQNQGGTSDQTGATSSGTSSTSTSTNTNPRSSSSDTNIPSTPPAKP